MVRREEQPQRARCTVLLDTRRIAYRGAGPGSAFEWAVSGAASALMHMLERGFAVRLLTDEGSVVPGESTDGFAGSTQDSADSAGLMMDTLAVVDHSDGGGLSRAYDVLRGGNEGLLVAFFGDLDEEQTAVAARMRQRSRGPSRSCWTVTTGRAVPRPCLPRRSPAVCGCCGKRDGRRWRCRPARSSPGCGSRRARRAAGSPPRPDRRQGSPGDGHERAYPTGALRLRGHDAGGGVLAAPGRDGEVVPAGRVPAGPPDRCGGARPPDAPGAGPDGLPPAARHPADADRVVRQGVRPVRGGARAAGGPTARRAADHGRRRRQQVRHSRTGDGRHPADADRRGAPGRAHRGRPRGDRARRGGRPVCRCSRCTRWRPVSPTAGRAGSSSCSRRAAICCSCWPRAGTGSPGGGGCSAGCPVRRAVCRPAWRGRGARWRRSVRGGASAWWRWASHWWCPRPCPPWTAGCWAVREAVRAGVAAGAPSPR